MTLPANIRVNVRAAFPTRVKSSAFIRIAKANGVWSITPDYTVLARAGSILSTQIFALQDTITGAWQYANPLDVVLAALSSYRVITAPGTVVVAAGDMSILLQKTSSGASTIDLPASATRSGAPLTIKDLTGDAHTNNITIVPSLGETIDGLNAATAAAKGLAVIDVDYGSRVLYPLSTGGWYTL